MFDSRCIYFPLWIRFRNPAGLFCLHTEIFVFPYLFNNFSHYTIYSKTLVNFFCWTLNNDKKNSKVSVQIWNFAWKGSFPVSELELTLNNNYSNQKFLNFLAEILGWFERVEILMPYFSYYSVNPKFSVVAMYIYPA